MVSGKDTHGGVHVRTLLRGIPIISSSFRGKGLGDVTAPLRLHRLSVTDSGKHAVPQCPCCIRGRVTSASCAGLVSSVGSTMQSHCTVSTLIGIHSTEYVDGEPVAEEGVY
jgi:hypothetical protein